MAISGPGSGIRAGMQGLTCRPAGSVAPWKGAALRAEMAEAEGALRVISDCHFRKAGTEYDRETGIKWLSYTEK